MPSGPAPQPVLRVDCLVQQAHGGDDPPHDGAHGGEEGDVALPVALDDLHVEGGDLVEEEHTRQAPSPPRVHVPEVLGDAVLVRLDGRPVPEPVQGRDDL